MMQHRPVELQQAISPKKALYRIAGNTEWYRLEIFSHDGNEAAYWDNGGMIDEIRSRKWACGMEDGDNIVRDEEGMGEDKYGDETDEEGEVPVVPKAPRMPSQAEVRGKCRGQSNRHAT